MENEFKNEISLEGIISKSIDICKNNYKLLLRIYVIATVMQFIPQLINYFVQQERLKLMTGGDYNSSLIKVWPGLSIVFSIIAFAVLCRITVALITSIKMSYYNESRSYRECMVESQDLGWQYFGANFLYGLMGLPLIVPYFIMRFNNSILLKILMGSVIFIWLIYIHFNYSLGSYITAYKPGEENFFKYSQKVLKNNRINYLFINLISLGFLLIISAPNLISVFVYKSTLESIPLLLLSSLLGLIYVIIQHVITVVALIDYDRSHLEIDEEKVVLEY